MATLQVTVTNNTPAPAGPLPGPVTNSYVVDASPFSMDKTIFAGETLFDAYGQEIPLSGSASGVPDGTKIWARPILESDGSTPTWGGWREVGTASGGVWSGAYPQCKRLYEWMHFDIVADGSDQVHTMTTRFGVGIVALIETQSELARIMQQQRDGGNSYTIGHTDDFFQLTWRGVSSSDEDAAVAGGIYTLNDATSRGAGQGYKTYGMDRMAAMAHRNQVMMRVCMDIKSGSNETEPLNPFNSADQFSRNMNNTPIMAANMKADGAILNIAHSDHFKLSGGGNNEIKNIEANIEWLSNAFYGTATDGSPYPGISYNGPFAPVSAPRNAFNDNPRGSIEYTWADNAIYPEFRGPRPPIHLEGNSWRLTTSSTADYYDVYGVRVINNLDASKRSFWPGKFQMMTIDDNVHASDTQYSPDFGQTRQGAQYFVGMLMACGVLPMTKYANFDRYKVADDGSYVLYWFSEGPVTTIERTIAAEEGRAPVNLNKPGYDNVQVVGFMQDGTASKYTQVEIVADDGVTLADAGAVKIYALPGEDFRTDPLPTYLQKRSGIDYDTGDKNVNATENMDFAHYSHYPVFDPLGTLRYEAPLVNPPGARVPTSSGFSGAYGNQIGANATESASLPKWP